MRPLDVLGGEIELHFTTADTRDGGVAGLADAGSITRYRAMGKNPEQRVPTGTPSWVEATTSRRPAEIGRKKSAMQ